MSDQPEHPMAARLFREFRHGSKIMTKIEAYAIGNEINALLARTKELEAAGNELVRDIRAANDELSQQIKASLESLGSAPR